MYELIIGGCSGTNAPAHARPYFGHLTTSFGLLDRTIKQGIVIDNGTGVQVVAKEMLKAGVTKTTILQTHCHLDHTEGLQLNSLLFGKTLQEIIAPDFEGMRPFPNIFAERFNPSAWPVCPETFGIKHHFSLFKAPLGLKINGNVWVNTLNLSHPGGAVAYRFDIAGGIVIATDNELANDDFRRKFADFVSGATLLVADCQYTDGEYEGKVALGGQFLSHVGWGHSTPLMLAETLKHCRLTPKEVWLTHHDPSRTDNELKCFERMANDYLRCKIAIPIPNHALALAPQFGI